ncbi:MAG: hypothetical protein ACOH10_00185 [Rhodoglobus sp.]
MARQSLGALLGNVEDSTAGASAETSAAPETRPALDGSPVFSSTPRVAVSTSHPRPRAAEPVATPPELPAYLRLVRKETRLREDQQNELTLHARRLNRAKVTGAVRVTDNTLIRVAVDLLLARIEQAAGDDEAAILESLNP